MGTSNLRLFPLGRGCVLPEHCARRPRPKGSIVCPTRLARSAANGVEILDMSSAYFSRGFFSLWNSPPLEWGTVPHLGLATQKLAPVVWLGAPWAKKTLRSPPKKNPPGLRFVFRRAGYCISKSALACLPALLESGGASPSTAPLPFGFRVLDDLATAALLGRDGLQRRAQAGHKADRRRCRRLSGEHAR